MSAPDDREAEWIARVVIHDDREAFAKLLRLHQDAVRRFLARLCGDDRHRADDLAQETFWKAYRHIGGYRASGRFLGWLFGIAWQLHAGEQRGIGARVLAPLPDQDPPAPDEALDVSELIELDRLLAQLPPREQAVMLMHYRHGLTQQEIANALAMPLGTIKSLIGRACAKLRERAEQTPGRTTTDE